MDDSLRIPDDTDGCPHGRAFGRRSFLAGSAALSAVGLAHRGLGGFATAAPAVRRAPAAVADRTLVLVTLYGGNDGLNTVVPIADPAYEAQRGNIAIAGDKLLDLGSGYGLNPAMPQLKSSFDAGHVAIVRGVGYPNPSLSHFQSMDIWQTASTAGDVNSGWLGRWLDRTRADPLKACSIGASVQPALAGSLRKASAIQDSTSGYDQLPQGGNELLAIYKQLERPRRGASATEEAIAAAGTAMLETSRVFSKGIGRQPGINFGRSVNPGDIGQQLDIVSRLMRAGLPTQVYAVDQNGFDTHAGELETQNALLGQLDTALAGFFSSLAGSPRLAGTVVVVYSEFGRRVGSNASGGTDHGAANNVYVLGPSVRGGFYGEAPSLTHLDENGNLVHNVDFRSVYSTVLEHVIGVDPASFLGRSYPTLGFL